MIFQADPTGSMFAGRVSPVGDEEIRVEIHLRNRVLTFTGVSPESLNQIEAMRGAYLAGKTGGVDLGIVDRTGAHHEQFNYEDIVRIEIESRRSR